MAIEPDDLRAAVAAGAITEAQAANIMAIAQDRLGHRQHMTGEDEPFEFFRGFSEIFISAGLTIFLLGIFTLLSFAGMNSDIFVWVPALMAVIAWWMARYFTLKRRMILPSMLLAVTFGISFCAVVAGLMAQQNWPNPQRMLVYSCSFGAAGMGMWYWRFRLPAAMFFAGLGILGALYSSALTIEQALNFLDGNLSGDFFDLGNTSGFAISTLGFGIGAFILGMWFDLRDPHRLGRRAATGFWLHLLAAPALVNTVALSLYNLGGTLGILSMTAAIILIAILALVIDRRSFLTAGIIYIALAISWAIQGDGGGGVVQGITIMLILGAFITALGTWWVQLRAALMRKLPQFPGKSRLPPYRKTIEVL